MTGTYGYVRDRRHAARSLALPGRRHCEERSDEAIHSVLTRRAGLLRYARNDVDSSEPIL